MKKPYLPVASFEEVLAFNPSEPSTLTKSPLVNAVAEVLYSTNIRECKAIADVLALDVRVLRDAMKVETGIPFKDLVVNYRMTKAKEYIQSHPELSQAQLAQDCGFASYHAMWRFFQNTLGETPSGEKSNAKEDVYTAHLRQLRNR